MLRVGAIILNVSEIEQARSFWAGALGYEPRPHNPDFLAPPEGDGVRIHLDSTDAMHLDLWADSEEEQLAEVERLISLGATRVEWQYPENADFVVLADPDGNLFCVINAAA